MRFNPPPDWPPAPPGWVPDSNWIPDPSWPPPPPGWQLWVDDSAPPYPPQFMTGCPSQFPPQYPPQWQPSLPPGPTSRKGLWIALAAVAAVVLVSAAAIFVFGAGGEPTRASGGEASEKSDVTQLTEDLLVGKSAFPEFGSGGNFYSNLMDHGRKTPGPYDTSISPEECADLLGAPTIADQSAGAGILITGGGNFRQMAVTLAITPNQLNLKDIFKKCHSFSLSFDVAGHTVKLENQVQPLDVPAVPPWAIGAVVKSSTPPTPGTPDLSATSGAVVTGYYRGVLILASYNNLGHTSDSASIASETKRNLVKLFNGQVEKLEAAT